MPSTSSPLRSNTSWWLFIYVIKMESISQEKSGHFHSALHSQSGSKGYQPTNNINKAFRWQNGIAHLIFYVFWQAAELEKASKNLVPEPIAAPPCDSSEVVGKKGKRNRNRRRFEEEEVLEETFFSRNKTTILVVVVVLIPILTAYYLCT